MHAKVLAVILGMCVGVGAALGGDVELRDGRKLSGSIAFKVGDAVEVTPAGGAAVVVKMAEVARLQMADAAPATEALVIAGSKEMSAPWRRVDVGRVRFAGDAAEQGGVFTVRGSGWGIWGLEDSFQFVYQPLTGDGEIVARLADLGTEDNRFLAGVTIREGEATGAEVSLMSAGTTSWRLNARTAGGPTKREAAVALGDARWIRLLRAGDAFSAYGSVDGKEWLPAGAVTVKMNPAALAGLACAATANQALGSARFDHVSVRRGSSGPGRGAAMVDGSLVAGEVTRMDGKTLQYRDGGGKSLELPMAMVASVFNGPLPAEERERLAGGKPAVVLGGGDVIEGEVRSLEEGKLAVMSLIMGPQTLEWPQVRLLVLRPSAANGSYKVATRDGSVYRGKSVTAAEGGVKVQTGSLGEVILNAGELVAVDGR